MTLHSGIFDVFCFSRIVKTLLLLEWSCLGVTEDTLDVLPESLEAERKKAISHFREQFLSAVSCSLCLKSGLLRFDSFEENFIPFWGPVRRRRVISSSCRWEFFDLTVRKVHFTTQ